MLGTIAITLALLGPGQKDKPALDAACAAIAKATGARDWKKLATLCTPDFTQQNTTGPKMNLKGLEASLAGIENLSVTYKLLDVNSNGKVAICKVFWRVKGTVNQQGVHHVVSDDTEMDTFKKVNGKWLESYAKEISGSGTIDGKPIGGNGQIG